MKIIPERNGSSLTAAIAGRIDANTAPEFGRELESLTDGVTDLTLDFDAVEYISSAGLRMLLLAQKKMNRTRGAMRIINVSEDVYQVLEATGFVGVSDISLKQ